MIEALALTLGGTTAALVGVIVWLVYGRIASADAAADARVAQVATEGHLERAQFELETMTKHAAAIERRATALEEVIRDEVERAPNPDLARDDIRGRVLRIASEWAAADRDRAVPAGDEPAVPQASAPAAPAAPAVSAGTGTVP